MSYSDDLEAALIAASWSAGYGVAVGQDLTAFCDAFQEAAGARELTFSIPLSGVTDTVFNFLGERWDIASALTATYSTATAVQNNHVVLHVNSLTGSGSVVVTGTSLSESTAVPVASDTESITVDATGYYQSDKKWLEITAVTIPGGITAINYDVEAVGYPDGGNTDFRIVGYRLEAYAAGATADFGFTITKVQDDGNKKCSFVVLEDIGVDANGTVQVVDSLRTGADDRSYTPTVGSIWGNNTTFVFKQTDFGTYFTGDQANIEGQTKNEGYIVRLRGEDGAGGGTILQVDFINLWLRISNIIP